MDISKHIDRIKKRFDEQDPEFLKLQKVFSLYVSGFNKNHYKISYGKIFIKNIHPLEKAALLLKKEDILKGLNQSGLLIKDIL